MSGKLDFSLEEALQLMSEKSGVAKEELQQKVKEKVEKFSGLLTEQGAVVLVSKDLRIPLPYLEKKAMHVPLGKLQNGMANIDIKGKVSAINPIKTFSKGEKEGKYLAVKIKDESGEALFTFWNEQVDDAQQKQIGMDSEVTIQNARVKTFNNQLQLSLGFNATYTITPGKQEVRNVAVEKPREAITFSNAQAGQFIQAKASIVEVMPGRGYYIQCEGCKAKPRQLEESCSSCGRQNTVKQRLLLPLLLDDGFSTMRAVAFEEQAMQIWGKKKEEIVAALDDEKEKEKMQLELMGKRLEVSGKTKTGMDNVSVELLIGSARVIGFQSE
ncbi:MAG: hypothetical protein IPJ89_00685 [Candidatus Iainarchaeum archaeon]|uniref:Replication factor A C-terminal domain-containing protein n=1 Tax=Candidatus Iainarchaeum sp. TaxID=3101447 RepID=A0A7T9DK63_9ARCH|nr:MAG: hypothetical protein IPJ89_00685 [Candidatus Diapherotrites archaeon]